MDANKQQLHAPVRLVAANSLWIAGFQGLFGDPCGVEIVAVSVTQALSSNHAEIVLIDSGSFRAAGSLRNILERFRQKCPDIRLIVIGCDDGEYDSDAENLYIQRLIQAGAKGFLSPSARPHEFSAALHWVRSGSIWAPRQVLSRLVQSSQFVRNSSDSVSQHHIFGHNGFAPVKPRFTPREAQVLKLLIAGRSNREIGEILGIGPDTVKAHLGRIMRKAGVTNRIELTMYTLGERGSARTPPKTPVVVPINGLSTMN